MGVAPDAGSGPHSWPAAGQRARNQAPLRPLRGKAMPETGYGVAWLPWGPRGPRPSEDGGGPSEGPGLGSHGGEGRGMERGRGGGGRRGGGRGGGPGPGPAGGAGADRTEAGAWPLCWLEPGRHRRLHELVTMRHVQTTGSSPLLGFLRPCDRGRPNDRNSPPAEGGWTAAPEVQAEKPGLDGPLAPGGVFT